MSTSWYRWRWHGVMIACMYTASVSLTTSQLYNSKVRNEFATLLQDPSRAISRMMGQESYTRIASLYPDIIENEKNIYIDPILRIQKSKERLQAAYAQNPQSREVVVQLYRIAKIQNDHNAQTRYRSEIEVLDPFYISSGQLDSK